MIRIIKAAIFMLALSLLIAGCGKKGPPQAPDKSEYPRSYPAPR